MVVVEEDVNGIKLPCRLNFDSYLLETLKDSNKAVKKGWDIISLMVGYEGDGKTTLAMQCCLFWDHSFNIDRVVFNASQFEEVVDNAPKESSILWDEADDLSGNWSSEMVLAIKRKLKRIRRLRLKIILCTPTFHDLNKYFAISRTRFLIHVYAKGLERGYFRAFGRERKKKLYIYGKKEMDLGATNSDFNGKFLNAPKGFPIDLSEDGEYDLKKESSTQELINVKDPKKQLHARELELFFNMEVALESRKLGVNRQFFSEVFGVDVRTISRWRNRESFDSDKGTNYITYGVKDFGEDSL